MSTFDDADPKLRTDEVFRSATDDTAPAITPHIVYPVPSVAPLEIRQLSGMGTNFARWFYVGYKIKEVGMHRYTRTSTARWNTPRKRIQDQCLYLLAGSVFYDTAIVPRDNHVYDVKFDVVLLDGQHFPGMQIRIWYGPKGDYGQTAVSSLLAEKSFASADDLQWGTAGSAQGIPHTKKGSLQINVRSVSWK